ARGGGPGWGPHPSLHQVSPLRTLPPSHPPPASGGRSRDRASVAPDTPSPARGGGPGWGPHPSLRQVSSLRNLPPSRPSPASGGRSRDRTTIAPHPPPPRAGESRGEGRLHRYAGGPRCGAGRHPGLPPQAGEGAGTAPPVHLTPLPRSRGRAGVGAASIATPGVLAAEPAPIPTFPRKRGKEQGPRFRRTDPPPRLRGRNARLGSTRLRPMGRGGAPRIFRPRVLRIATLHFLAHLRVGAVPEPAQVAGHLQRPASRREQVQGERDATVG